MPFPILGVIIFVCILTQNITENVIQPIKITPVLPKKGTKEEESVTFYNVGPDKRMSQVNVLYVKRNCT